MKTENSNNVSEITDAELKNVAGGTATEGMICAAIWAAGSLINPAVGLTAAYAYAASKLV